MLILVRHGQTELNASGRLQGRIDVALTEQGRRQAAALAAALPAESVVCSPLARARQTAEAFGVPVTVDERWIEMDYGSYDGAPLSAVPSDEWARWRSDPTYRPPGGESVADVGMRVRAALAELVEEARTRDVVVVSHVSPVKAAVAWALGVGDEITWRMHLSLAAISRIGFGEAGPVLHSFNETSHLEPLR